MTGDQVRVSVYGAYIVEQVSERIRQGRGCPGPDDYDRFHEEAETVAEEAVEAFLRATVPEVDDE